MRRMARAADDGRVSRRGVRAADGRRPLRPAAARLSARLASARCADVHPFQGDDRGRRAGARLAPPTSRDGRWAWIPSATSRSRLAAIRACVPAFATSAIGCSPSISVWTSRCRRGARARRIALRVDRFAAGCRPHVGARSNRSPIRAAAPSQTLRATIDPDEPIGFGATVEQLVPPVDATGGQQSAAALDPARRSRSSPRSRSSSAINARPEFQAVRDALAGTSSLPSALWIGTSAFVIAGLLLVPLELLTIAAAVAFGALRGGMVGRHRIAGAGGDRLRRRPRDRRLRRGAMGQPAIVSIGADNSARSGVVGVIVLRLSSVASTGAIHLLCGAGRVPFRHVTWPAPSSAWLPAIVALSVAWRTAARRLAAAVDRRTACTTIGAARAAADPGERDPHVAADSPVRAVGRRVIATARSSADAGAVDASRRHLQRPRVRRHRRAARSRSRRLGRRRTGCRHRRAAGVHLSGQRRHRDHACR